jgi:hypothetical protein
VSEIEAVETVDEGEADLCRRVALYLDASDCGDVIGSIRLADDLAGCTTMLRDLLLDEAAALGATWEEIGEAFGLDALGAFCNFGAAGPDPPPDLPGQTAG